MATLRDDAARIGRKLLETVEERTGREVVPTERLEILESAQSELRVAQKTLEFIGFSLFNYQPNIPGQAGGFELRPQVRRLAAQQALRAWVEDPMAGQHVDLYVSFVLGRGVPRPAAHDAEVQEILDRTWDDAANRRVLTSFEKLSEKAVDLCIQSNVYFTIFDDGEDGMARASLLRFDDVEDVVRHPDDRFRILYYKVIERPLKYDFHSGSYVAIAGEQDPNGGAKTVYYEAWDGFDDDNPSMVAQDAGLERVPAAMKRDGKVVHLAVNKTSEMAFGVPRMRRLMRWFTAYNETLESHVSRMKAMASIYMKATAKGGQGDLDRLARMATNRPSAFGASQEAGYGGGIGAPPGPGIIGQNESLNYEPFKIDSGATDVQASAPIIRGQVNGPWPDHYTAGTAGELAGATAMELPVLKFVEREQEMWIGPFRTLGHAAIQAAIRVGDLDEWREPTQAELERIQAAEAAGEESALELNADGKVKRDLGFDISLPSPLKRAMGDIVTAAVSTATAVDPNGENPELSRWLLGYLLAEAFDVEDPQRIVDQVLPREAPAPPAAAPQIDPMTGQPIPPVDPGAAADPGAVGADGQRHTEDNAYGAPRQSPQADGQALQEAVIARIRAARRSSSRRRSHITDAFDADVQDVALEHLRLLDGISAAGGSTNGHGPHT